MHLFIQLVTLGFFLLTATHAWRRGREAATFFWALVWLGFWRENFVVLEELLYEYAPLSLMLGRAPLISGLIWSYSIYVAVIWAEGLSPGSIEGRFGRRSAALAGAFMIALACFYEPFLGLIGMAKWEEGTRSTLGVPWIALVGYPTMTWLYLGLWEALRGIARPAAHLAALLAGSLVAALGHAWGLQALKDLLGW